MVNINELDGIDEAYATLMHLASQAGVCLEIVDGALSVTSESACMSNIRASAKERQRGEPCFIELECLEEFGLRPNESVVLSLAEGSDYSDARLLAKHLNNADLRLSIQRS